MSPESIGLPTKTKRARAVLSGMRLRSIFVYGSYARGESDAESDLDVLIVLDRIDHYAAEVDRTSQIVGQLALRYGVSISRVFVSEDEWLHGDSVFLQNVREEADADHGDHDRDLISNQPP